jgi:cytochrome b involved in lipid metabolism
LIINGGVYDVTSFLADHPGGKKVILVQAGKDATAQFNMFHKAEQVLARYAPKLYIGQLAAGGGGGIAPVAAAAPKPVAATGAVKEQKKENKRALTAHPNKFGEQIPYGNRLLLSLIQSKDD